MTTKLTGYVWAKGKGKGEKGIIFFVTIINKIELDFLDFIVVITHYYYHSTYIV
jgi:hypothetical protein